MLHIHIDSRELWDEKQNEFVNITGGDFRLEHSLVSISKWEAKYHKPFLTSDKTRLETLDYVLMMDLDEKLTMEQAILLTNEQTEEINKYINNPMTATIINEEDEKDISNNSNHSDKFVSSEEMYSWMVAQQIPFEVQYWHLNRLIILIKLCAINNKPKDKKKKPLTSSELTARRIKMEAARKKYGGKS